MHASRGRVSAYTVVLGVSIAMAACGDANEEAYSLQAGELLPYCDSQSPPILAEDGQNEPASQCSAEIAHVVFRYGLCTCDGYASSQPLFVDAFDSRQGPYAEERVLPGGSVGTNGGWNTTSTVRIGGSFIMAPDPNMAIAGDFFVRSDLRRQGDISHDGSLHVGGSAEVSGRIIGQNLRVDGTLTLTDPSQLTTQGTQTVTGFAQGPVNVAPPCDCNAAQYLDVAAVVARHATSNDNAAAGVDPNALLNYDSGSELELPCGRFHLAGIHGQGPLTLKIRGRVALFVAGHVNLNGPFRIELLGDDASLDLFFAETLVTSSTADFGGQTHPDRVRTYFGGTGTVNLGGNSVFAGHIYAPRAELVS